MKSKLGVFLMDTGVHVDTRQHQVARQSRIVTIRFDVF